MLSEWLGTTAKEAERAAKEAAELVGKAKNKLQSVFGWVCQGRCGWLLGPWLAGWVVG
jgi:hypothetical protein